MTVATWNTDTMGPVPDRFTGRVDYFTKTGKLSHYYLLDSEPLDGVTTILSKGVAKPFLTRWAGNMVAEAAVTTAGYWKMLEKEEAVKHLKNAPYRSRNEAGAKGTEVHAWADHYAKHGVLPHLGDVDEVIRNQVAALGRFFTDFNVKIHVAERVVFNRVELYAGTFDGIMWVDGMGLVLVDYKTAKGVYPETALQLAAYRYADFYMEDDGTRVGLPGVDSCAVLHLPANPTKTQEKNGGYSLIPMQADRAVYRTFLQAKSLARFADKGSAVVGKPYRVADVPVPVIEEAAEVVVDTSDPFVGLPK